MGEFLPQSPLNAIFHLPDQVHCTDKINNQTITDNLGELVFACEWLFKLVKDNQR